MGITLERLLVHPRAFGLDTATPVQRAICRVADGLPLGDLANDHTVVRTFGGPIAMAALPTTKPTELYVVAAIRCGKSMLSAALAFRAAMCTDLSHLAKSEVARVSVVSLDRDKAKIVMEHLMGALQRPGSALRRHLMRNPKPTDERIRLRREDGRRVDIVVAAGRRGGGSLVSRWTVAAIFDEAARMLGQEDGVVNFDDMRKSVIVRLGLIGGQLVAVTSPWAARGPIYDATQENWGRPSKDLVVVRATGPEMNPVLWTPAAVELERTRVNGAYETDVLGEFVDPENGWLSAAECRVATRQVPLETPHEIGVSYTAAMDPAVAGNAWTLVIVGKRPSEDGQESRNKYFVALARQWQGTPGQPLKARAVFAELAPLLASYKLNSVHSDRWGGSLMAEIGDYGGVTVDVSRDTAEETSRHHNDLRTLLLDGRLELPPHQMLQADLLSMRKRLLPGGQVKYIAPVTRDGRHADYADAIVLAVARASTEPSWVDAMNAWRRRGSTI